MSPRRTPSTAHIVFPEGQRFECRDCPARCCMHWSVTIARDEAQRILGDEWCQRRLGERGATIVSSGMLPMVERDRRLQCVFLDDDYLCAMQKRHGHAFLPTPCQAFPFGFVRDERQRTVAVMSQFCPSIRDNYGSPLAEQIETKLIQRGGSRRLASQLATRAGVLLAPARYLRVVDHWTKLLTGAESVAQALVDIYDWTSSVEAALAQERAQSSDQELDGALHRANELSFEPLISKTRPSAYLRMLSAYSLGNLSYPSRVFQSGRMTTPSLGLRVRAYANKLAWLFGVGLADLLLIAKPVPLGRIHRVTPFLGQAAGHLVGASLVTRLERRQVLTDAGYLMSVLVELAMAAVVVSRFARAAAAADGRPLVCEADIEDGLSVADLLFTQTARFEQDPLATSLRWSLVRSRKHFRRLLASEA